ncbi:MAG: preprotein translocase subunit SecY [Bacteroidia bacterium]|nr:preprotein translocase subunit SecY [Bacteroidia bacterium]MCO5254039.1 preprotein translocase subunit SecY [Bacteroidota bacterium]
MSKFRLIRKLQEIWSIEELRTKILNTLFFLLIYRLGTFIILPGIDSEELSGLKGQTDGSLLGLINVFAGGAFARGAFFALGIMPYISASIVIQLMGIAVPAFQKMQKEGEDGRRKLNQITRYLTVAITLVQSIAYLVNITSNPGNSNALLFITRPEVMSHSMFMFVNTLILTAGTIFVMWLGEKITDKGLGNGISLIIMIGIIDRLPGALTFEMVQRFNDGQLPIFIVQIAFWLAVIVASVLLVQGTRKIPVNYAKRVVGNRQYGGSRQYIPLKVNAAGVMPIIFAQALMFIPPYIKQMFPNSNSSVLNSMDDWTSIPYNIIFAIMIIAFTYFYTVITINPKSIAEELKKNGGFVPGVKPGKKTSEYIDTIMSRIILPGSLFLALVSIMPAIAVYFKVGNAFAQFYGGTSLLIMVGVVLDTLQQIESYLLMRHYDGLMKTGRIKGRTGAIGASI